MNLQTETLWRALCFVSPFASRDTTRPHLYKVAIYAIHDSGGQRVVVEATDGHTMAVYERNEGLVPGFEAGSVERLDLDTATAVAFMGAVKKLATAAARARDKSKPPPPPLSALRKTKAGVLTLRAGYRDRAVLLVGTERPEEGPRLDRVWPYTRGGEGARTIAIDPAYGERAFNGFRRLKISRVRWLHSGGESCPVLVTSIEGAGLPDERCAALLMPQRSFASIAGENFPYPSKVAVTVAEEAAE